MKLDILVMASHPDDVELGCGGTIARHIAEGYKVGIVDFTRGELGTRGTPEIRLQEAAEAARILGVSVRENLGLKDGFFQNDPASQLQVIRVIRKFKPAILLANAVYDRHVDHGKGASLAYDASFLSGLSKIRTSDDDGRDQEAWRPEVVYHYIQSYSAKPDFVVDISDHWETKMKAILAFRSQFHNPDSNEPETYISDPAFMKMLNPAPRNWVTALASVMAKGLQPAEPRA
jgi:bacillithiol biosynthesis deacetylase BshB1